MTINKTPHRVVELLKQAVEKKGQSGVSRETGLTQPAIHRYLKGIGEPSTKTLQKLADYFGVSVGFLRGEEPIIDRLTYDLTAAIANSLPLEPISKGDESEDTNIDYFCLATDLSIAIGYVLKRHHIPVSEMEGLQKFIALAHTLYEMDSENPNIEKNKAGNE
jgi:transcriptional regulator with XRE-family HTH domain